MVMVNNSPSKNQSDLFLETGNGPSVNPNDFDDYRNVNLSQSVNF